MFSFLFTQHKAQARELLFIMINEEYYMNENSDSWN